MLILEIIVAYLLVVFFGLRFIVPHFGFAKSKLPESVPPEIQQQIDQMNAQAKTPADFLRIAYDFVGSRYHGGRLQTLTHFWKGWANPLTLAPGFWPCNISSQLLRIILVKSGRFADLDIRIRYTSVNLFIHQYLQVRVDGMWTDVDAWGRHAGVQFGKHACFFV